jgi:hypothetical protein
MISAIVGFFATAGAAGVDICMSNRNNRDVSMGGIFGVIIAIVFTAGVSCIVMAGAHATGLVDSSAVQMTAALEKKLSPGMFAVVMIGLTLAAFPGACFSSFIAANFGWHWGVCQHHLGRHRRGGPSRERVRTHRRLLWSYLRGDDGGLPAQRRKMERPARRLQFRRLDRLGARLHRRHPPQ